MSFQTDNSRLLITLPAACSACEAVFLDHVRNYRSAQAARAITQQGQGP